MSRFEIVKLWARRLNVPFTDKDLKDRENWQKRLFFQLPSNCEKGKYKLLLEQVLFVNTDADFRMSQKAAALTLHSIWGIIPLFAMLLLLTNIFGDNVSIAHFADSAVPYMHNTWQYVLSFSRNLINYSLDLRYIKVWGPLLVICSTYSFYRDIQTIFCDIWDTGETPSRINVLYGILVTIVIVVIGSILYNILSPGIQHVVLTFFLILISLFLGYYFVPKSTDRNWKSTLIVSLFTTILLIVLWTCFDFLVQTFRPNDYVKYGEYAIFFVSVWFIQWTWRGCLSGAILHASIEGRIKYYRKIQSDNMFLFQRLSLAIMVASCVYRTRETTDEELTIHQIRLRMFKSEGEGDENEKQRLAGRKEAEKLSLDEKNENWLPLPLLQSILDELVLVKILKKKDEILYVRNVVSERLTVGDLLYALFFNGSNELSHLFLDDVPSFENRTACDLNNLFPEYKEIIAELPLQKSPLAQTDDKVFDAQAVHFLRFRLVYVFKKMGFTDPNTVKGIYLSIKTSVISLPQFMDALHSITQTEETRIASAAFEQYMRECSEE